MSKYLNAADYFKSVDEEHNNNNYKCVNKMDAFTMLWVFSRSPSPNIIKELIDANALNLEDEYKYRQHNSQSVIAEILEHTYDTSMLRLLLENGADPNLKVVCLWNYYDFDRCTKLIPSFFCVNTEEQLDVLIEFGIDINKKDDRGRTLFQYSLQNYHSNIAYHLLMKYGYQPTFEEAQWIIYKEGMQCWYAIRDYEKRDNHQSEYDPQKRLDLLKELCSNGIIDPNSKMKDRRGKLYDKEVDIIFVAEYEDAVLELIIAGATPIGKDKCESYLKHIYGGWYAKTMKKSYQSVIDLHEYLYIHPYKRTKRAVSN